MQYPGTPVATCVLATQCKAIGTQRELKRPISQRNPMVCPNVDRASAVARHPNSRVRIGAIQLRITARPGGHGIKSGIDGVMAASKRSRSKVETESGTGDKEFPVTSFTAAKRARYGCGEVLTDCETAQAVRGKPSSRVCRQCRPGVQQQGINLGPRPLITSSHPSMLDGWYCRIKAWLCPPGRRRWCASIRCSPQFSWTPFVIPARAITPSPYCTPVSTLGVGHYRMPYH